MTVVYPTADLVADLNSRHGGAGGGLVDRAGLEGALGRPQHTAGGEDVYPELSAKAAALLHGLASTQYFSDGNKRTAWVTAVAFLQLNGQYLVDDLTITQEAFVRAVATKELSVERAAEWFERHMREWRLGPARDSRIEWAMIAQASTSTEDGRVNLLGAGMVGLATPEPLPLPRFLAVPFRIHWRRSDAGTRTFRVSIFHPTSSDVAFEGVRVVPVGDFGPGVAGHANTMNPVIYSWSFPVMITQGGKWIVNIHLDDSLAITLPFTVAAVTDVPDVWPGD